MDALRYLPTREAITWEINDNSRNSKKMIIVEKAKTKKTPLGKRSIPGGRGCFLWALAPFQISGLHRCNNL